MPTEPPEPTPDRTDWGRAALFGLGALLLVRLATLGLLPLIDSTESRYALVAADMAESGDWVTPQIRIHDHLVPFEGKPPLHFWVGAAAVELFGRGELAARLPSLLAGLVTLGLVLRLGARVVGVSAARASALLLALHPFFFAMAGVVALDLTLTATTTAGILLGLGHDPRAPAAQRRRESALLGLALGLGFLTKGPIALAIVGSAGLAVCAVRRSLDPLRGHVWWLGGLVLLLVAAPWFVISELRRPGFLEYFFIQENWLRYTRSEIGDRYGNTHAFFPGVSLLWWCVAALPLAVVLPLAARRARRRGEGDHGRSPPFGAVVAASLGIALVLAPSRQILVTYLLPSAPIAALAAGHAWVRSGGSLARLGTAATVSAFLLGAGHLIAEPKVSEERSTRDVIARANAVIDRHGLEEIVFPRKTPWSAHYYGAERIVLRMDDRYLMRIPETIAEHPRAVYVMKGKLLRRLRPEIARQFEIHDRERGWGYGILHGATGKPRAPSPGAGRIGAEPSPTGGGVGGGDRVGGDGIVGGDGGGR